MVVLTSSAGSSINKVFRIYYPYSCTYVNMWIAKVTSHECDVKILLTPMLNGIVWSMLCCALLVRRCLHHGVIYSHYVIMLTNVHTHSHIMHAYIVVKGHGV